MKKQEKKILLVISGGIAAYKSLELIRLLNNEGISVLPLMTESAKSFVTPLSVSVISGEKVASEMFDVESEMNFSHIELSRAAGLVVVAPATANILAKFANGLADDLASTVLLATDKKVLVAPSMNVRMWEHNATKRNVAQLIEDGVKFVGPVEGELACGEYGYGRMAALESIVEAIKTELDHKQVRPLAGKRILVTSGPTEEAIDPVRYISNRSSGIQGTAIANSLIKAGAQVVLVSGPVNVGPPDGARLIKVVSALDMLDAVEKNGPYDVAICAAAVSDWRPKKEFSNKIKKDKSDDKLIVDFVKNPDILEHLGKSKRRPRLIVGFSAETDKLLENAAMKLKKKNCDWILGNDVSPKYGVMGGLETEITLINKNERKAFPRMSKVDFANLLVERIICEIG